MKDPISLCAAIIAIIMAIIVMVRSFHRERLARRASAKAEEAMRLASLAIERVSSSRASRKEAAKASDATCLERNQAST